MSRAERSGKYINSLREITEGIPKIFKNVQVPVSLRNSVSKYAKKTGKFLKTHKIDNSTYEVSLCD